MTEDDVLSGEGEYSRFAFDALRAEEIGTTPSLDSFVYQLLGENARLTETELTTAFARTGANLEEAVGLIDRMIRLGVLGVETRPDHFEYSDDESDLRRNKGLARGVARIGGGGSTV